MKKMKVKNEDEVENFQYTFVSESNKLSLTQ